MTRAQYSKKMERIIKTYETKQNELRSLYDYYYANAMTAREILSIHSWFDKENDRINEWYGKAISTLSKVGWQE